MKKKIIRKPRSLSAKAVNGEPGSFVELKPNEKLPMVLPPSAPISDDVFNIVQLASDISSKAAAFSLDVSSTLDHIRQQIAIVRRHHADMDTWHKQRAIEIAERHLTELEALTLEHTIEIQVHESEQHSALELCSSMLTVLTALEAKFSSKDQTNG